MNAPWTEAGLPWNEALHFIHEYVKLALNSAKGFQFNECSG